MKFKNFLLQNRSANFNLHKASSVKGIQGLFFFSNERPSHFLRGDNNEITKLKIFSSRTTGTFLTGLGTKHHWVKVTQGFTMKDHSILKKEIIDFLLTLSTISYNQSFVQMCLLICIDFPCERCGLGASKACLNSKLRENLISYEYICFIFINLFL